MSTIQNPFDPSLYGGVMGDHSEPVTTFDETAAKVRFRIKDGPGEGHVYQGQRIYQPCIGCGQQAQPVPAFEKRPPKRFVRHEPRGPRAIVIPWLSVAAVWDEIKYCLRSIERYWTDRECPIYIIGDAPPKWLEAGGRVEFIHVSEYVQSREKGLYQAFLAGMQIAEEVAWWNDDIYLIRETGWEDLRVALTEGDLMGQEKALRAAGVPWQLGLGDAVEEMKLRGKSEVWRFATHTPYLFEIEKSREIFQEYYLHYKGSWVTLYHNHHGTPHMPCKPYKVDSLPTKSRTARYLNHRHAGPDGGTKKELSRLLLSPAAWERQEPVLTSAVPHVD